LDFHEKAKKAVKIHKIDSPFLVFMESTTFKVPSILLKTMSATNNNNNTAVENTVKEKKPALSGKYSKFMIFGYSFVQSLHGEGVLTDEGLEAAYSQLKMFDSVDSQTDFYEQILEQGKASGVVMRKLIRQRNAPPKAPKEKKARKPRAKKTEEKKEAATPPPGNAKDVGAPKKASKSRAKKEEAPVANLTAVMDAAAEELEEEDVVTQEIIIGGTTYLIDEENNLYSVDTHEEMGTYNPETQEISREF